MRHHCVQIISKWRIWNRFLDLITKRHNFTLKFSKWHFCRFHLCDCDRFLLCQIQMLPTEHKGTKFKLKHILNASTLNFFTPSIRKIKIPCTKRPLHVSYQRTHIKQVLYITHMCASQLMLFIFNIHKQEVQ